MNTTRREKTTVNAPRVCRNKGALCLCIMLLVLGLSGCSATSDDTLATANPPSTNSGPRASAGFDVSTKADYPNYDSQKSLMKAADLVVVGEVVNQEARDINVSNAADREVNPLVYRYEVARVVIMRVIKGTVPSGDVIEVKQLVADDSANQLSGRRQRGIFFLEAYPDGVPYSLSNPHQGVLRIENGRAMPSKSNKLIKRDTSESDVVRELESFAE